VRPSLVEEADCIRDGWWWASALNLTAKEHSKTCSTGDDQNVFEPSLKGLGASVRSPAHSIGEAELVQLLEVA
jgi:hypothetical protein